MGADKEDWERVARRARKKPRIWCHGIHDRIFQDGSGQLLIDEA